MLLMLGLLEPALLFRLLPCTPKEVLTPSGDCCCIFGAPPGLFMELRRAAAAFTLEGRGTGCNWPFSPCSPCCCSCWLFLELNEAMSSCMSESDRLFFLDPVLAPKDCDT